MKIAVIGVSGDGALAVGLVRGAAACGHQAELVDGASLISGSRPLILARRARQEGLIVQPLLSRLRRKLLRLEPDLILIVKGRFIPAEAVEALRRRLSVPILNYYPDHPLWPGFGEPQVIEALHAYDEVLVWSRVVADPLRVEGVKRVRVVPFAYDPLVYRPPPTPRRHSWDAVLLGQCYPERVPYAEAFADCRMLVSGSGWKKALQGGPLDGRVGDRRFGGTLTCETYWRSATALNILSAANVPAHNMRTFEIPASETVMVATRTPEHIDLLGENGAILADSPEEARDRALELLQEPEMLQAVAQEGRKRIAPHTYASRIDEMFRPWLAKSSPTAGHAQHADYRGRGRA